MSLQILRGFTLFINDTRNLFFEIDTLKLASKEENTEDFQPGGGDLGLAVSGLGIKPLSVGFKSKAQSPDVVGLFGGPPGVRQKFTGKKFVVDEKGGGEHEHAIDISGRLIKAEDDEMKGGSAAGYDFMIGSIDKYAEMHDGRVLHRFNFWTGGWEVWNYQPINEARRRVLLS